jgi:hypothetical protein
METAQEYGAIDGAAATRALETVRAELGRLDAKKVQQPRLDVLRAVQIALGAVPAAKHDLQRFEATFVGFAVASLRNLETYALAAWEAETAYRRRQVEEAPQRTPPVELVERCRARREDLLAAGEYLFRGEPRIAEVVADVRSGAGHLDLADDLNRLAELFRTHWPTLQGRCDVTREQVTEAHALAIELMRYLAATPDAERPWLDLRNRAWTALQTAYDEIRAAAAYAFRHEPAHLDLYPSFFSYPRAPKKAAEATSAPVFENHGAID